ncbi:Uncharacterized protein Rs2_35800 [Raphanus sativus]|nr:Uncharacterized protein Rs2_35800 [Raphanus sativus]
MSQGQWVARSGGKKVEMVKAGVRVKVPRFDNSALIASFSKTLIGRCMNPPKQDMKTLLFMLPRIWGVEGRVVGTDLGLGLFQFGFDVEEDIVEEENNKVSGDAQEEEGSGATSYKAMVANGLKPQGDRREAQSGRTQAGRGADKGKGIARDYGSYRQEGSYHPYKEN